MINKNIIQLGFLSTSILILFVQGIFAQSQLADFSPGAKSVGLGRTGVIEIYDPSALYWNPASLGYFSKRQAFVSINEPYHLNYSAYSHFIPLAGSFAASVAQTENSENGLEIMSIGWGKKLNNYLYFGLSLNNIFMGTENWMTTGIGFLLKPEDSALFKYNSSSLPSLLSMPFIRNKLTLGFSMQNIPITDTNYEHQTRAGISYLLTNDGLKLIYAHQFQRDTDNSHFGFLLPLSKNVTFYTGIKNFKFNKTAFGTEIYLDNFNLNVVYDYNLKRIVFSSAMRIGSSNKKLADDEYKKAQQAYSKDDRHKALYYSKRALEFDSQNDQAGKIYTKLNPEITDEKKKISQFLKTAAALEEKQWFISAATQYMEVLKLEPSNKLATNALTRIRPKVDVHTERRYKLGVEAFENNDLSGAKEIFSSILLVSPDHAGSKNYLSIIDTLLFEQAENHFFTGLGYYSQHNLEKAEEEFTNALKLYPSYAEAQEYNDRIEQDKIENRENMLKLGQEAKTLENKKSWFAAKQKYEQILEIDPANAGAKVKILEMDNNLADYINSLLSRGETLYNNLDFSNADKIFAEIIRMQPDNDKARQYLNKTREKTNDKSLVYYQRAVELYNREKWENTLSTIDSALTINPRYSDALKLKNNVLAKMNVEELVQNAMNEYQNQNYLKAMEIFNQVLSKDPKNTRALNYLELCQNKLNDKVDEYFNTGLQLYSKENYRMAIQYWQKALEINPNHKGSIEYIKRANERLTALERLQ